MLRCLASLERLPIRAKVALGDELGRRLSMRNLPAPPNVALYLWALGRIGARAPLYGPLDAVVPPQTAATWLRGILRARLARPAGDRVLRRADRPAHRRPLARDVDEDTPRTEVAGWLAAAGRRPQTTTLVTDAS